jgi:hypothetical protein
MVNRDEASMLMDDKLSRKNKGSKATHVDSTRASLVGLTDFCTPGGKALGGIARPKLVMGHILRFVCWPKLHQWVFMCYFVWLAI